MASGPSYLPRWPWEALLWISGVILGAFLGRFLIVHVHHVTKGR